jgi:hypothetical protein
MAFRVGDRVRAAHALGNGDRRIPQGRAGKVLRVDEGLFRTTYAVEFAAGLLDDSAILTDLSEENLEPGDGW